MTTEYRHDVDGLRAIAVFAVLLFHLDFEFISGGFVGVDIFYVISGYVIFKSIVKEVECGTFSLLDFYKRRIRRILPALLITVLLSYAVGYFILTPREFVNLSHSAIASLLSYSNFYFFDTLGYFSDSAKSTPLLHTWSLGIEEQFYLIMPIVFLMLLRFFDVKSVITLFIFFTFISFLYNILALSVYHEFNQAFYLPIERF